MWPCVAILLLMAGCDQVFGLSRDSDVQFCDRFEQHGVAFCEDFDKPEVDSDPDRAFAAFTKLDPTVPGARYEVESVVAHSLPRAARLTATGPGSPYARLSRPISSPVTVEGSFWMRIVVADTNHIRVFVLSFNPGRSIFLTDDGVLREVVAGTGVTLGQFDLLPLDRWFKISFALDLSARSGTVSVDAHEQAIVLADVAIVLNSPNVIIGPHVPAPANTADGWTILYDDVIIR